ncbi:MAG: hypothetical protein E7508_00530 [Ruminococcus sp.]|nr:hypothetical protein [Ruminococcus sp.]
MQTNISVKISDMDYEKAVELLKKEVDSPFEKMALGFMGNLPPKLLVSKLMGTDTAKGRIMDKVNRQLEENGLDINIYNFFIKDGEEITVDFYLKVGDILPFIQRKINFENNNVDSFMKKLVNTVFTQVPDSLKVSILNQIFKESEQEICRIISDKVSEKWFDMHVSKLVFFASDI